MKKRLAFTMAEAILVMTILGVIATIMITTIKPSQYKEQALLTLGRKVMTEIDSAMSQIIVNDTTEGTMESLLYAANETVAKPDANVTFSMATASRGIYFKTLIKKYLATTRTECNDANCPCYAYNDGTSPNFSSFYLKDGACVGIKSGSVTNAVTFFPGETQSVTIADSTHGVIFFDANGKAEPNVIGKDQFLMPLDKSGINYEED